MKLETVCFIETDSEGSVEWGEGCVCVDPEYYEHYKELVDKAEAMAVIESLERRISDMGWALNPDRMGS